MIVIDNQKYNPFLNTNNSLVNIGNPTNSLVNPFNKFNYSNQNITSGTNQNINPIMTQTNNLIIKNIHTLRTETSNYNWGDENKFKH